MSLFEKCYRKIMYDKIAFQTPKNASTESIQRSVSSIDWDFSFRGKSINKKVDVLHECLKNIFHNFVPNKVIKCDYRRPPWMTDFMKIKLKESAKLTKKYFKCGKKRPTALPNERTKTILEAKEKCI